MKKITDKMINGWTDEEVLANFQKFFPRITIVSKLVSNEDEVITHQALIVVCGDLAVSSTPQPFEWPLQYAPMPENTSKTEVN